MERMARHAAAFALFFLLFAWRAGDTRIGSGYLDPIGRIGAQDEAVYTHAAIRMAERGDWLTPRFLDRFFLYKPPLLYWLSGASIEAFGAGAVAARLPSLLAAAAICAMLLRLAGPLAAGLAAGDFIFASMARRNMTDMPLAACVAAVAALLWRDPRLENPRSRGAVALAIAAAVLIKGVAAAVPVLLLVVCVARERGAWRRALTAAAAAAVLAAPWFAYQYAAHPRWFVEEFVGVELLAWGAGAPPQQTSEAGLAFYPRRLWDWDPALCLLTLAAIPGAIVAARRERRSVPLAWAAVALLSMSSYQYRNATYLTLLVPALAWIAGAYAPMPRFAAAALGVLMLLRLPGPPAETLAGVDLLERRCEAGRSNDLIVVNAEDQFHATVLPIPRVRYAIPGGAQPPKGFSLDFKSMGVTVRTADYLDFANARARFEPELRAWGLPDAEAFATVIALPDPGSLAELVSGSPGADFLVPAGFAAQLPESPHQRVQGSGGGLLLLSPGAPSQGKPGRSCRM